MHCSQSPVQHRVALTGQIEQHGNFLFLAGCGVALGQARQHNPCIEAQWQEALPQ
jgi:hypothetical protein